jgi:glucose dehydrogenase
MRLKTSMHGRIALSLILPLAAGVPLASCGGNGTAGASPACTTVSTNVAASPADSGSWAYANADLANTRDATGSTISSANVSRLAQAWTFKLTGKAAVGVSPYGALTANPIVQHGVV